MIEQMPPDEYAEMLKLISGLSVSELSKIESVELISILVEGFRENRVITLLDFFTELGK